MEKTIRKSALHLTSSRSLPLYRSINSLAVMARYIKMKGTDAALLLAGTAIQPGDLDDPDILVTPEQEIQFMRNIIDRVPEPGLGLFIGRQYHTGIMGKLGAAMICSNTLLDVLQIMAQYSELLLNFYYFDLTVKGDLAFLKLKEHLDLKDIRAFVFERESAAIHRIAGDLIGGPFPIRELRFAHPQPKYVSLYRDIFQCPIVFNAEDYMIVFDSSSLYKPLAMVNPLARKTYEKECRDLSLRIKEQGTIAEKIHQEIVFHRDGFPSFNQLARYMNLSPRTLSRHLTAEGTSYKDIISKIRKSKAINLLQTTAHPIEYIASELGYSTVANFYRAFKEWTGQNPGNYRKKK